MWLSVLVGSAALVSLRAYSKHGKYMCLCVYVVRRNGRGGKTRVNASNLTVGVVCSFQDPLIINLAGSVAWAAVSNGRCYVLLAVISSGTQKMHAFIM